MALSVMLFPALKSKPLTPSRYSMSEQLREGVRTRARSIIVHNSSNSSSTTSDEGNHHDGYNHDDNNDNDDDDDTNNNKNRNIHLVIVTLIIFCYGILAVPTPGYRGGFPGAGGRQGTLGIALSGAYGLGLKGLR